MNPWIGRFEDRPNKVGVTLQPDAPCPVKDSETKKINTQMMRFNRCIDLGSTDSSIGHLTLRKMWQKISTIIVEKKFYK